MTEVLKTVPIQVLNKAYDVKCKPGQEEALISAVDYLDEKMREIRNQGRLVSTGSIALMAALNMSHELLKIEGDSREIYKKIDETLAPQEQLAL